MSKFAEACKLSYIDWAAQLPDIDNVPEHEFSSKHIKEMNKLFDKMRGGRYHYFTTKTVRVMLVAAIIAAFVLTAFVIPSSREFILENFDVYGTFKISEHNNNSVNGEISVGYIPEGYELVDKSVSSNGIIYVFQNNEEKGFYINKHSSSSETIFDLENGYTEKTVINNITYFYSSVPSQYNSIFWIKNDYVYQIDGELSMDELLKIAQEVK